MTLQLCILFLFTGLTGIYSLTTVSEVSVRAGSSVSVPCMYESKFKNHVKYLCEGHDWLFCRYMVKTNQAKETFLIRDDRHQSIFTVTIGDAKFTHYWCAVEIDEGPDVKMYFKLSLTKGSPLLYVDHQEVTGFHEEDLSIRCRHTIQGENQWCRLGESCVKAPSGSINGIKVIITADAAHFFTVTMRRVTTDSSGWYLCKKAGLQMPLHVTVKHRPSTISVPATRQLITSAPTTQTVILTSVSAATDESGNYSPSVYPLSFIILLGVVIFILMMALFIWFMLKRCKKSEESTTATPEENITYSVVTHRRRTPFKRSCAETDVTYSSVVTIKQQKDVADVDCVTYSTPINQVSK